MRKREAELTEAVCQYLTLEGYSFMRVDNYRCYKCGAVGNRRAKGWPDIFIYHPEPMAVEVKIGQNDLTDEQERVSEKMQDAGIPYLIVRDTVDPLFMYLEERR